MKHGEKGKTLPAVGIRVLLISVLGLVIAGAITVFWSAREINYLKDEMVVEAREQALATTRYACKRIESVLAEAKDDELEDALRHPEVVRQLQILSRSGAVILAEIVDMDGRVLCREIKHPIAGSLVPPIVSEGPPGIPSTNAALVSLRRENLIPLLVPIHRDDLLVAQIQLGLSREMALGRIETLGSQITGSLSVMVLLVIAILILTIVLVVYTFQGHLHLLQRTSEAEHLADLGALASGLAHEIRNPLHAMNLHLEVVREDMEDAMKDGSTAISKEATTSLQRVEDQITRLSALATHFLELSIPCRMKPSAVRLDPIILEAVEFLRPQMEERGVDVSTNLSADAALTVQVDSEGLHQVLLNLMLNAAKAMADSPTRKIVIHTQRDRKHLRILVDDSGPGIPAGQEEAVFRAFTTKRCGGTGIGLSLARRIMEGHGGSIHAERSPDLGGARISLAIPLK